MKTSFRQLTYVTTAARLCNISQAAKALHISTSSVLAAIDKAEQEFEVTIFDLGKNLLSISKTG